MPEPPPNPEDAVEQLLSRLTSLSGVSVTDDGDILHRDRLMGHLDREEQRLTVPLRADIPGAAGFADELVAEHPRLRREGDEFVLDLGEPDAITAAEKLVERRLTVERYGSQYLGSSP